MDTRIARWLGVSLLCGGGLFGCDDGGNGGRGDAAGLDAAMDGSPSQDGTAGDAGDQDADADTMDAAIGDGGDTTDGATVDEAAVDAGDMDAMVALDATADAMPDADADAAESDAEAEAGEQDAEAGTDAGVPEACQPVTFEVTADSAASYTIDGELDPTLTLCRGVTYTFELDAPGHPFYIKTEAGNTGTDETFDEGVDGAGAQVGTVTFAVPQAAPDMLHYQCSVHAGMTGVLDIIDP